MYIKCTLSYPTRGLFRRLPAGNKPPSLCLFRLSGAPPPPPPTRMDHGNKPKFPCLPFCDYSRSVTSWWRSKCTLSLAFLFMDSQGSTVNSEILTNDQQQFCQRGQNVSPQLYHLSFRWWSSCSSGPQHRLHSPLSPTKVLQCILLSRATRRSSHHALRALTKESDQRVDRRSGILLTSRRVQSCPAGAYWAQHMAGPPNSRRLDLIVESDVFQFSSPLISYFHSLLLIQRFWPAPYSVP